MVSYASRSLLPVRQLVWASLVGAAGLGARLSHLLRGEAQKVPAAGLHGGSLELGGRTPLEHTAQGDREGESWLETRERERDDS